MTVPTLHSLLPHVSFPFRRAAIHRSISNCWGKLQRAGWGRPEGSAVFEIFRLQFRPEPDTGQRPGIMLSNTAWPQLSPCSQSMSPLAGSTVSYWEPPRPGNGSSTFRAWFHFDFTVGTAMWILCNLKILVLLLLVFCLKVRDQEFPYRRNLARVIVNVEDANDHSPYFTNPLYEASVFESAALGSAVLQVTALDKDKGENAELMYTIEAGESCCRQQHHAWHWTLRSIYHRVKFS